MALKKILAWIVSRHPHGRSRNARTYLRNVNSELLYLEFTWRQKNSLSKMLDVSKNPWAVRKVAIKFKHVLKRTQFSVLRLTSSYDTDENTAGNMINRAANLFYMMIYRLTLKVDISGL